MVGIYIAVSCGFSTNRWCYCQRQSDTTLGLSLKLDRDISLLLVYTVPSQFIRLAPDFFHIMQGCDEIII